MRKKYIKRKLESPSIISKIINIIISCFVGILISLLMSFAFSFILSHSESLSKFTGVYFIIAVYVGGFSCGFLGTKILSFKGFISGLLCGIPYIIFTIILMLLISKQPLNFYSILFIIGALVSNTLGGIISANTKRRK